MTYQSDCLALSPWLYWRLGEASGGTAADATGNGRVGTYGTSTPLGAAGLLSGNSDTAMGPNDSLAHYVRRTSVGLSAVANFSVVMWIKTSPPTSVPESNNCIYEITGSSTQLRVLADTAGTCSARIDADGFAAANWTGIAGLLDDARHMVAFTFASGSCKMFIDGAQSGSTLTSSGNLNIATIKFGGAITGGTAFPNFIGDEFAIFTTTLSPTDIANLYATGTTAPPPDQDINPAFAASDGAAYDVTLLQSTVEVGETERPAPSRRLYPAPQIRVGGHWLSTIAAWGDLDVKHGRNGPTEVTFGMALGRTERPSPLIRNAWTEVYAGPHLIWSGTLGQIDWDSRTFAAIGISRQGEGAECMTGGGAITSKPNTAIDAAIARDVANWTRVDDFGNTDIAGVPGDASNDDPDPGKLNELLNLWAFENESQWRVTADGRLIIAPEVESEPDWLIMPGAGELGVAEDDVTDRVFLYYRDSTANRTRVVSYPASTPVNGVERQASVIKRGEMSAARALAIATGIYKWAQRGRTGWTNGVELSDQQVTTLGGQPANLALILPGQTARMLDTPDPRDSGRNLDFVIGDTSWTPDSRTIQVNPVGLAKRSFEQILTIARAEAA